MYCIITFNPAYFVVVVVVLVCPAAPLEPVLEELTYLALILRNCASTNKGEP